METTLNATHKKVITNEDYSLVLDKMGVDYTSDHLFLAVGQPSISGMLVVYASVIRNQIADFLVEVVPVLTANNISFRIVKDRQTAKQVLSGIYGVDNIGKIMTIYIPVGENESGILQELIGISKNYKGPAVPGCLPLGGLLYISNSVNGNGTDVITRANRQGFLNHTYLITGTLKKHIKGDVLTALYLKKFYIPAKCVIKEGVHYMWSDDAGRDITDRLLWQQKIHQDLAERVNTPKILEVFETADSTWLTMEFIKGKTLTEFINTLYSGRTWLQLDINERKKLLVLLLKVIEAIEILHSEGYLHRDITPENFLVTKTEKLYMIDLELAYHEKLMYPLPAFGLGTPGYMSPEQQQNKIPTVKEDIYSLGALMIVFFTNLPPYKFELKTPGLAEIQLHYFIGDYMISGLLEACFFEEPMERPSLDTIKQIIRKFKGQTDPAITGIDEVALVPERSAITAFIDTALQGMIYSFCGRNKCIAISALPEMAYLFYLTGANYTANQMHQYISSFLLEHIENHKNFQPNKSPGLVNGLAGNALALHYGMLTGLFSITAENLTRLTYCFYSLSDGLFLRSGIAGQALAACLIFNNDPTAYLKDRIMSYLNVLVTAQLRDGSWSGDTGITDQQLFGLTDGMPGIIMALIQCDRVLPGNEAKYAIEKGLLWLKRNFNQRLMINEVAFTALTFLHAYEHLKIKEYKEIAEKMLWKCPAYAVSANYNLETGMAGIGLVYTEAARITQHQEWKRRACWIYRLFENTAINVEDKKISWHTSSTDPDDLSLLTGISGIIYFLLQFKTLFNE
ncbi:serine/threonine protein kinase [Pedobacter sp. AK017]|uniref:protein kinase domain-containing protein n=1 Tax=Pedobacter sp. AK017 TaxID=2723073 RepID=UPI001616F07F|nr:lanthionine synthetase LanC family protein [Pedobacter sp. AK017]MBB5437722.1 serine/threonine protein kinase [Pedobacter sp. AK017]